MPARAPRVTRSEAVVIRHRRFGDSDRIVTLLTPARGKIDAIAKGALRPRSRLAGHLEPLTHAEVLLAHGRNLDIITQAQTIEGFAAIRDDLDRLSLALYLLELADRFTVEHAEADAVYRLLLVALLRLARGDGEQLVARSFELALLDATGFRPEWRDCAACAEEVAPDALAWSPLAGGVICAACRTSHPEAGPIDETVLKVLRFIQQEPYEQAARVRLTPELASGLEWVMHELMRAMAERDLGSARFLSEVRQTPRADAAGDAAEAAAAGAASAERAAAYTEPDELNA
ncbi:MAG: DNA repair protein RecO [Chloroflexi bacterium]|nr:DNA repair protein RecO [Chloroflexota bacterium]